ncbi:carboxylesterase family protein, partial [Balneolaceae bacterium ANBcel3]|nr:carboxylesterase family protein [Balneolaceae bacterium ANBcel3]
MSRYSIIFVFLMAFSMGACSEEAPGVVTVEGGQIRGKVTDDLAIFKGIPFAAPPVGELRWKAPQPVEAW